MEYLEPTDRMAERLTCILLMQIVQMGIQTSQPL